MAQSKRKHKRHGGGPMGKPSGMTLADVLAMKARTEAAVCEDAKSEYQRILADREAQRAVWCYMVALHDAYQFGPKRFEELDAAAKKVFDEYNHFKETGDQDYADEKLRQMVSKIKGHEVNYAHEDLYPVNDDLSDEAFHAIRESVGRIR